MKTLILISSLLVSSLSWAQISPVTQGSAIQAQKINELINKINELEQKTVPIGTIFHSILTPAQFKQENGDCWKLMDSSTSIAGSDLSQVTGFSSLPDAVTQGYFLRQAKPGRALISTEQDDNKLHFHYESMGYTQHGGYWGSDNLGLGNVFFGNGDGWAPISNRTQSVGSAEARPKNIAVNLFIKYKRQCSFL